MVAVVARHVVGAGRAGIERCVSADNCGRCSFRPLVGVGSAGRQGRGLARTDAGFSRDSDIHRPAGCGEPNRRAVRGSRTVRGI